LYAARATRAAAALLLAAAALLAAPCPAAGVVPGALVVRTAGRAPVLEGRADLAFQQALEEALRRGVLDALRSIAPERQSPRDLETWQETVLPRAADFVAAWRILAQREKDGFVDLEVEIEVWRDKLARGSRATAAAAAAPAVRVLVLADPFPLSDPAADEEVDAGRLAAVALEGELSRRGAVIVATTDRAPWGSDAGPSPREPRRPPPRPANASSRRRARRAADAARGVLAATHRRRPETTLAAARAEAPWRGALDEAFLPAARQIAGAIAPRLPAARSGRARGQLP
jgi:hypothetical protein